MKKNKKVKLILISGGTSSGKTTIARNIAQRINKIAKKPLVVNVVEIDNYYFEISHWGNKKETEINWDEPSSINWALLKDDLNKMLNGETVKKPRFNYATNSYSKKDTITYKPADVIILEGIFALYDDEILNKADNKIFVHADADIRLIRRIKRDRIRHPSLSEQDILNVWAETVKPMHDKWIQPQISNAQIVIQNSQEEVQLDKLDPLDWLS